VFAKRRTWQNR